MNTTKLEKNLLEEADLSWEEYAIDRNILRDANPDAFDIAKGVYITGFILGVKYATETFISKVQPT